MFLGESGSGKSETALNFAVFFAGRGDKPVHFFDMDQTKPLFRSRDVKELMERHGIVFHHAESALDAPTLPGGVIEMLENPGVINVMDVGGNLTGARMVGQFSRFFKNHTSVVYYLINCYRPFSYASSKIRETMESVLVSSSQEDISIIANPNFGSATTTEDVLQGFELTSRLLKELGCAPKALAAPEVLVNEEIERVCSIIPIKQYLCRYTAKGGKK
jgi:hypothetical protein